jgi:YHS domain-containing protein
MKYLTIVSALIILAAMPALQASPKPTAQSQPLVCPVTGEKIASTKDAAGHSIYKGKTYYFCCPSCKPMFDANPAKYVKPSAIVSHKAKTM